MIEVRRLGYAMGAAVTGVDLTKKLNEPTVRAIREAWLAHIVLCFPDQDLDPDQLLAFGASFGEVDDNRGSVQFRHPENERVTVVASNPVQIGSKRIGGYGGVNKWHSDRSVTIRPATMTILTAKELPDVGGNTMFANMYKAYEALSPAFQAMIAPLDGIHDVALGPSFSKYSPELQELNRRNNPLVAHALVRVHPESRKKALFIGDRVRTFAGMTDEEAKPLIRFLLEHATRYEFLYRHVWSLNDVVMWDNRCSLHNAVQDYDHSQQRRLIRCALMSPKSGYFYKQNAAEPQLASGAMN